MYILFLDTETSGLTPRDGQIIEIAGVVARFDPSTLEITETSRFQELVKIRDTMDERITRLTGITTEELLVAPNIQTVQDKWANWLEQYDKDIVAICGHSIQFDITFLKAEGWLLPEVTIIDTLDVSKILLPQIQAVNLEFIVKKLNLEKYINTNIGQAHRALFDTFCCVFLLQKLITILTQLSCDTSISYVILQKFLPLPIQIYSQKLPTYQHIQPDKHVEYIDIKGKNKNDTTSYRLNTLFLANSEVNIQLLINLLPDLGIVESRVVLQCIVALIYKNNNPHHEIKIHINGIYEKVLLQCIIDVLEQNNTQISTITETILVNPESIISHIRSISEYSINITECITYLELYNTISSNSNTDVQKIIASADFLSLIIQPFLLQSEYSYNPSNLSPEERVVSDKLNTFYQLLLQFNTANLSYQSPFSSVIINHIDAFLKQLQVMEFSPHISLVFRFFGGQFSIARENNAFNHATYIQDFLEKRNIKRIKTALTSEDFKTFTQIAHTTHIFKNRDITYQTNAIQTITATTNINEFLQVKKDLSHNLQQPIMIFCGQNSTLRELQKELTTHFDAHGYLVLGETGSLTKIISKITHGFKGIIGLKINDFHYLIKQQLPQFAEIWIVNEPFLYIAPYWRKQSQNSEDPQEYIKSLKHIHLLSCAGEINEATHVPVNYLRSYIS